MKLSEILEVTRGTLAAGGQALDVPPERFSTDSRTLRRGDFFIAITGPAFDGNDYISDAFRKGACGAITSRRTMPAGEATQALIKVNDTTKAYGALARHHRMKFDIPLIAVTGSCGKTTTKDMIAHILSGKFTVLKNEGTKNNHIGVPETLLRLSEDSEMAVLELGMNHAGEIRYLGDVARPTMAAVTNVGPSHLGSLKSLRNIFKAKAELLECLPSGAPAIVNGDDEYLSRWRARRLIRVTFGLGARNDFRANRMRFEAGRWRFFINGRYPCELKVIGRHNVYNALAAIAVSSHFNVGYSFMCERLSTFSPEGMRLAVRKISGIEFINDAYNSNPSSMKYALDALVDYETKGQRIVVAGDMLELGPRSRSLHAQIGERIAHSKIDLLLTVGKLSGETLRSARAFGMARERAKRCATHEDAARHLTRVARPHDVVLVKGSRAMRMEKVIENFEKLT